MKDKMNSYKVGTMNRKISIRIVVDDAVAASSLKQVLGSENGNENFYIALTDDTFNLELNPSLLLLLVSLYNDGGGALLEYLATKFLTLFKETSANKISIDINGNSIEIESTDELPDIIELLNTKAVRNTFK